MKRRQYNSFEAMLWCGCGMILALLFAFEVYMPRRAAVAVMFSLSIWTLATTRASRFSLLQRLIIVLYVLPFSVMIGYFFDSNYIWELTPLRIELLSDHMIVTLTLSIGLVGLLGLVAGMRIAETWRSSRELAITEQTSLVERKHESEPLYSEEHRLSPAEMLRCSLFQRIRSLGYFEFILLLATAIALSYIMNNDSDTIFSQVYRGTSGFAQKINFSAAGLLSYLIFILLFIDVERDRSFERRLKMLAVVGSTALVVIFFELIRGNRDAIGLIVALMALYLTGDAASHLEMMVRAVRIYNKRLRKLLVPALAILVVYVAITPFRTSLSNPSAPRVSLSDIVIVGFVERSTWTSVLLTNVGSAYYYSMGDVEYLYGRTYVDYILSLPPGIVARLFDYERPLERWQGPNYWIRGIGRGGLHPVVVPFHNFGIFGVLIIMAVIGMFIVWVDNPNASTWRRYLYAGIIAGSFKWFWYGDMKLIRSIMGVALLWIVYTFLISMRRHSAAACGLRNRSPSPPRKTFRPSGMVCPK